MTELAETYFAVKEETDAAGATLVAVSKTKPPELIMELYDLGHRDFGENRVAELLEKREILPGDIRWHFIGHLQRNKVKAIAPFVHLLHAVDSPRLLREVAKQGAAAGRDVPVLLQYHIAQEASKYGLDPDEPGTILEETEATTLSGVAIRGVMGMATYTDDDEQIAGEFDRLAETFRYVKNKYFYEDEHFREISMGMSGDYPLALERGSTMVRVGSLLFGSR